MFARAIANPRLLPLFWLGFVLALAGLAGAVYFNAKEGVSWRSDFTMLYASVKSQEGAGTLYRSYLYQPQEMDEPWFMDLVTAPDSKIGLSRRTDNLNPPVFSFLVKPFAQVKLRPAYYLWCGTQLILALSLWLFYLRRHFPNHPAAVPLGGLAFAAYFPIFGNLLVGEGGLWYFAAITAALLAYDKKREDLFGLFLGLALTLKLFTGLIFIWLLLSRRWRPLFWGAGIYAALMLLGLGFLGLENHIGWLRNLQEVSWYSYTWNASLDGVLARYFGGGSAVSSFDWPLFRAIARVIAWGLALGALIWLSRQKNGFNLGLAACLPLMLLLSPLGWIYYFPVLFLAAVLMAPLPPVGALALLFSAVPQYLSIVDTYAPALWRPHYNGILGTMPGDVPVTWQSRNFWFDFCEAYTLALLILAVLPFVKACKKNPSP